MALHREIPPLERHGIHSFEVAGAAARDALAVTVLDIGKVVRLTSDGSFWILRSPSPPVWVGIFAGSGTGVADGEVPLAADGTPGTTSDDGGVTGNTQFFLANTPSDPTKVKVFVSGVRMKLGLHFTMLGNKITFLTGFIPLRGEVILVDYPY